VKHLFAYCGGDFWFVIAARFISADKLLKHLALRHLRQT